ncbi:cytochrome c-type biogenesis protein [Paenibacillus sp. JGP012]|nr:cytochrome c-type biogenesis protein [Paenibacillus sp. JGP012]
MEQVTLLVAFTAGALSFFSPCVFPLVPAYVSHISNTMVEAGRIAANRKQLFLRSIGFILGFGVIFVLMGASASAIGSFISMRRELIEKFGGILIIVFGLQMMGLLKLKLLMNSKPLQNEKKYGGWFGSFFLGLAFGAGWTPCVGLALSSILILAGSSESLYQGIGFLAAYSLGLGIPFLLISLLVTFSLSIVKLINRALPLLSIFNGAIMVALGVMLYTGSFQRLSAMLAKYSFFNF